jgi:hypothetical protein
MNRSLGNAIGATGVVALFLACGCSKGSADATAPSAPPGSASATVSAGGPGSAAPAASTAASGAAGKATSWRGTYKSAATDLTRPPGVSWKVPESTAGVGDGTIALTVEPTGRVQGTIDGALGPATVDGLAAEGKITANVARKEPSDQGFTGTLYATQDANGVRGTMNLAPAIATAARTASFELAPAPLASPEPAPGPAH